MRSFHTRHTAVLALPFTVIWASAFPATKFVLADCPPLLFLMVRFALAGALLLGLASRLGERTRPSRRDWMGLAVLAICNHALYLGVNWSGMRALSSGLSAIIIGASPIVVALLAVPLLGERLTARKVAGLLLGFAGTAFIVRHRLDGQFDTVHGMLLVVLALLVLSIGTVLYKRLQVGVGNTANAALQMLLAAVLTLPFAFSLEHPRDVHITPALLGALAWTVLVVSVTGYMLWFTLLRTTDAGSASAWLFVTPPLGLLMGWALLGEQPALYDFLGVIPVVLGIALVTRPTSARTPPACPVPSAPPSGAGPAAGRV